MIRLNRNRSASSSFGYSQDDRERQKSRVEQQVLNRLGVNPEVLQSYKRKGIISIFIDFKKAEEEFRTQRKLPNYQLHSPPPSRLERLQLRASNHRTGILEFSRKLDQRTQTLCKSQKQWKSPMKSNNLLREGQRNRVQVGLAQISKAKKTIQEQNQVLRRRIEFMSRQRQQFKQMIMSREN